MPKDLEVTRKIEEAIEIEFEKFGLLFDEQSRGGHHDQGADNNMTMEQAVDEAISSLKLELLQCAEVPCQEPLEFAPAVTRVTVTADTVAVRNVIIPKDILPTGS